jgi:hypothetical protein
VTIPAATLRVFVAIAPSGVAAPAFDIVVDDGSALPPIEDACAANPHAAIALVQLLRLTQQLPVTAAVVAESFAYSMLLGGAEFASWLAGSRVARRHETHEVDPVLVDHANGALGISLNRPALHNAYNAAMRDALVDVLRAVIELEDPPDVVLRGNGPSFSSGGDLAEFGTTPDPVLAHEIRTTRNPGLLLHELGARATARVHGSCVGAGVELPAFCARVEARADTTFRLPEIAMGLIPGAGGTASVTHRIGRQATAELAITGATIDAPTALRLGLVDAIHD